MSRTLSVWFDIFRIARNRRRALASLRMLSDHHLADIGLERSDLDGYVRLGYPWPVPTVIIPAPVFAPTLQGCG